MLSQSTRLHYWVLGIVPECNVPSNQQGQMNKQCSQTTCCSVIFLMFFFMFWYFLLFPRNYSHGYKRVFSIDK